MEEGKESTFDGNIESPEEVEARIGRSRLKSMGHSVSSLRHRLLEEKEEERDLALRNNFVISCASQYKLIWDLMYVYPCI